MYNKLILYYNSIELEEMTKWYMTMWVDGEMACGNGARPKSTSLHQSDPFTAA